MRTQTVKDANQTRTNGKSLEVRTLSGSEHYFSGQARIHTGFHRFMEIEGFFRMCREPRKWTLGVQKIIWEGMPRIPLEAFSFGTCFENRTPFILDPCLMVKLILFLSIANLQ